jgi:hypothetical protein
VICASCGEANPARARFCSTCGSLREALALSERKGNLVARDRARDLLEGSGADG